MKKRPSTLVVISFSISISLSIFTMGCATGRFTGFPRLMAGAALGAGTGAAGGVWLSPNDESKSLNALVFGLGGALVGGVLGILTDTALPAPASQSSLRGKEQDLPGRKFEAQNFEMQPATTLPRYLQERLTPVVVEEYRETDSVTEDGALHEPHKVYRIKRPAELISKPIRKPVDRNVTLEGGRHE